MVKHEIKVEISNSEEIKTLIQKAYFEEGLQGKILGKNHFLKISKEDDINYTIFKDLNGVTVKITNEDVIDGTMRFMVDESEGEVKLYPISIYAISENGRYIFY
jgi:hypothetical protein